MDAQADADGLWQSYLDSLPSDVTKPPDYDDMFSFGDSAEMANRLANLVQEGTKTATASALWQIEAGEEKLPEVSDFSVVLDGNGRPCCVIKTMEVEVVPFDEVQSEFARAEGEGFKSIDDWREGHWEYWSRTLQKIGRRPSRRMPVVCERFEVVHSLQSP